MVVIPVYVIISSSIFNKPQSEGNPFVDPTLMVVPVEVTFTVTNDKIAATDCVVVNHGSGGTAGSYLIGVSTIAAGSFKVTVTNASAGSLSEAIVINFVALKGASS